MSRTTICPPLSALVMIMFSLDFSSFNPLKGKTITFLYVQILPELNNRFVPKEEDLVCWLIIKVKILNKSSEMKFNSLKLNLSGFVLKSSLMKELNRISKS